MSKVEKRSGQKSKVESMKVCIAEKPSVAREIAKILGAKSRKDGYIEGNGYAVTWTFGHFCTLKEPDDYKPEWKKWNMHTLPISPDRFDIKLKKDKGVKKQFNVIKKLVKQASVVINCGDAGQEGELIQRWVLQHAKYRGKVLRLWISSLTPEAIRAGFRNLKNASNYDNLYQAGQSRAIGDWLLGMNATRLYTLKYGGYKQVLSIGRVQTPTLAMLVARHKEIENFVPQPYWVLQTVYREVVFTAEKGKFFKKEEGDALLEKVMDQPFTIVKFDKKKGKEYPPKLFDLTSLQVFCNKRYGYSADQTLKVVQQLYEQKIVTYPRVDTTYLPNDMYPKISGILQKMNSYHQFTQPLLGKKIRKSAKVFNDKKVTDHHAIIPTGMEKPLSSNQKNVYDAIARRFIAAFYPDCIVAKTTVIGEVNGVKFKVTGKEILDEGWRVLYPKPKTKPQNKTNGKAKGSKKEGEEERILPTFKVGESGEHEPSLVEKVTQPPKMYTEATLLRAMETAGKNVDEEELRELMKANGIGRPSTRANIIETLFRRKYIQRKRKLVVPTETGIKLIDTIDNELLKSAELTGKWEKNLRDIEEGKYSTEQFVREMKTMVNNLIYEVQNASHHSRIATNTKARTSVPRPRKVPPKKDKILASTCPKCQKGTLLKGKTAYGCSEWKAGCSFRLSFQVHDKKLPEGQLLKLVNSGSTILLRGFKVNGKTVNGKLRLNDNFEVILEEKSTPSISKPQRTRKKSTPQKEKTTQTVPSKIPCPKCGKGHVLKGNNAYGCSRWKAGCNFRFPFEEVRRKAQGKTMSKQLVWNILRGRE